MNFRHICIVSIAVFLVACPSETSSVEHVAVLEVRPDIACIWDRLLAISKWPRVQTIRDETPVGVTHRFNFETRRAPHSIGIVIRDDGSFIYRNTAWSPNQELHELQAAQQSLYEIDEDLDGRCNLIGLVDNVQRACFGKDCDLLTAANE